MHSSVFAGRRFLRGISNAAVENRLILNGAFESLSLKSGTPRTIAVPIVAGRDQATRPPSPVKLEPLTTDKNRATSRQSVEVVLK